ncbi:hypothetical protein CASFOL_015911 [Castilleja foliolosa]|uniref:Uncharacterized protein n=1 Tax=Castilleja foliolosa TaxID=1961234 RepID=A0ABD3DFG1_9LAMI
MPNLEVRSSGPTSPTRIVVLLVMMCAVVGGPLIDPPPSASPPLFRPEAVVEADEAVMEEDYAIWNPTPYFGGGGDGAPIPHPRFAFKAFAHST